MSGWVICLVWLVVGVVLLVWVVVRLVSRFFCLWLCYVRMVNGFLLKDLVSK